MKIIPPQTLTAAMVTSTAVEDVALYGAGATYALGVYVGRLQGDHTINVYQSLQAGNIGNTPESSPLFWKYRCDTYVQFNNGTTYAIGQIVYEAGTHLVFRSLQGSNQFHDVSDTDWWEEIGITNYWASSDLSSNTATTVEDELTEVIVPGHRFDTLALIGLSGTNYEVEVTSAIGGGTILYDSGIVPVRVITGWLSWMAAPFADRKYLVYNDIPGYTDSVITVTITSDGPCSMSGKVIGRAEAAGDTQYGARFDSTNFTRINRTVSTGRTSTQRRLNANKSMQTTMLDVELVPRLLEVHDGLDGSPALFVGIDDHMNGYYPMLAVLGVPTSWSFHAPHNAKARIEIEVSELL